MYKSEYANAEEIIKKCKNENIKMILNGIDKDSNIEVLELSRKYDNVYAAIGYDHSIVDEITDEDITLLENQIKSNKVVARGEIGIDYYCIKDNQEKQKELFIKQIDLANKYNLPIIVHSRDAVNDVYEILKEKNARGTIHCFSGSKEMAKEFIKLGCRLGIGGVLTFKNSKNLKEVVEKLDIDNFLLETDSPYLTPEPYRGHKNNPSNVILVAKKIAEIKGLDYKDVVDKLNSNAIEQFDLDIKL